MKKIIIEWEKDNGDYTFNIDMEKTDVLEVLGVLEMMKIDVLARSSMKQNKEKKND